MNKETDDIFEPRAEFLAEAAESMVELDVDLVSLQNDPGNAALLDRVFRLVHTIKGAAGFLDLPRLAAVTHAVEDMLGQMRAKDVRPSAAVVTQILRALDLIRTILTALEQEGAEPVGDDQGLIDALASHARPDTVDLVSTSEAELEALFDAAPGPPRTVAGEVLAPGAPAAHNGDDLGGVLQRLDQVTAALQDDMLKRGCSRSRRFGRKSRGWCVTPPIICESGLPSRWRVAIPSWTGKFSNTCATRFCIWSATPPITALRVPMSGAPPVSPKKGGSRLRPNTSTARS